MDYITIEAVEKCDTYSSGKAFRVNHNGRSLTIPNFAVHADSEIWKGAANGEVGKLIISEYIATEKGLTDSASQSLGGGIPLKRHRLPAVPELMSAKQHFEIAARQFNSSASEEGWWLAPEGPYLCCGPISDPEILADLSDLAGKDVTFVVNAPADMIALLTENKRLREWVDKALKTQERRKRK